MKASELMLELGKAIEKHGDLPVRYNRQDENGDHDVDVAMIAVYDKNGVDADFESNEKPVEIYLHATPEDEPA